MQRIRNQKVARNVFNRLRRTSVLLFLSRSSGEASVEAAGVVCGSAAAPAAGEGGDVRQHQPEPQRAAAGVEPRPGDGPTLMLALIHC